MTSPSMTHAQLRQFYEIEKELAGRLRMATKNERKHLYTSLYDELYRRVPYHPQLQIKQSEEQTHSSVARQMHFLGRFLRRDATFVEIGPGDCALSLEAAKRVKQVIAVDVSTEITKTLDTPSNFELRISDGCNIPALGTRVDVVYSNQLLEHLHPDDALEQTSEVFNCLVPGGQYVCVTPNRFSGPHDVSRAFDTEPHGFHLREYAIGELDQLFRGIGFRQTETYIGGGKHFFKAPVAALKLLESVLSLVPGRLRSFLGYHLFRHFLGIRMVATK